MTCDTTLYVGLRPTIILNLKILYRVETRFKNLFLIINNYIINLIVEAKARVKVLLLSVLNNFNNFFIDAREINILKIKDYNLIKILI